MSDIFNGLAGNSRPKVHRMWFDVYTQGILIGLVASIPLGPIGLLCIQRTLSKSHRSGFVSGLGAATADSMFATVALFSLTVVMSFIENNMAIQGSPHVV